MKIGATILIALGLASQAAPGTAAEVDKRVADAVLGAMDRTADPCADFYRFACGSWIDKTKLPADQSRWGRGFTEIAERNRLALRDILEEAVRNPGDDPGTKKLGAFYSACMDEAKTDSLGAAPLRPLFKHVESAADAKSLMKVVGKLTPYGVPALFGAAVVPDFKNPERNIAYFTQGGLGLPTGTTT